MPPITCLALALARQTESQVPDLDRRTPESMQEQESDAATRDHLAGMRRRVIRHITHLTT